MRLTNKYNIAIQFIVGTKAECVCVCVCVRICVCLSCLSCTQCLGALADGRSIYDSVADSLSLSLSLPSHSALFPRGSWVTTVALTHALTVPATAVANWSNCVSAHLISFVCLISDENDSRWQPVRAHASMLVHKRHNQSRSTDRINIFQTLQYFSSSWDSSELIWSAGICIPYARICVWCKFSDFMRMVNFKIYE